MSDPKFPTKLTAGIVFWADVYRVFTPIMVEIQGLAVAYAPDLLKKGHVDPIEFFTTILTNLDGLAGARREPIYYTLRVNLHASLVKADVGTRMARVAALIADQYDPSISKAYDANELDRWEVVVAVAKLLNS